VLFEHATLAASLPGVVFAGRAAPPRKEAPLSLVGAPPAAIWVLLFVALVGFAAWRLRSLVVPGWLGAPARLAELVLGISIVVVLAEVLGLAGALHGLALELGAGAIAAAAWAASSRARPGGERPGLPSGVELVGAATLGFVLIAIWMLGTLAVLAGSPMVFDSLWYHLPVAAGFAHSGSVTHIQAIDPLTLARFYPADSELVHAVGMAIVHRDVLSPLLAVGWMALALLGGWCIGRPLGVALLSTLGVGIVLGAHVLAASQPGNATNDVVALAALVCSAGLLAEGFAPQPAATTSAPGSPLGALFLAGLAAGLAVGTKLNVGIAVVALTVGVPFLAPRRRRMRALGVWVAGAALTGALWYARDAAATGTPLPWLHSIGPLDLPSPANAAGLRPAFTVAHYLTDGGAWSGYFLPGLRVELGDLWPLTLALALLGAVVALVRPRAAVLRVLAAAALAGTAAYVVAPLSAGGPEGHPVTFATNLRWLAPFLALGLALAPAALAARPRAWRVALAALMVAPLAASLDLQRWRDDPHLLAALLVALAAVAAWAAATAARRLTRGPAFAGPAVVALAAVAAAAVYAPASRDYLRDRFQSAPPGTDLTAAWRWAKRSGSADVALAGTTAAFHQYPFYGTRLSNRVAYLAEHGAHGALSPIASCRRWRRALDSGRFDYVVTAPRFDPGDPRRALPSAERRWARAPDTHVVAGGRGASVYRIRGPLDPASCPSR
jgi:hypothetical protein